MISTSSTAFITMDGEDMIDRDIFLCVILKEYIDEFCDVYFDEFHFDVDEPDFQIRINMLNVDIVLASASRRLRR